MTEQEFHNKRQPLYLDDNLNIKMGTGKYSNMSHAKWFNDISYPYVHTVRGYYMKTEDDEFIMLYWNDYEVPNINMSVLSFIFEYFPDLKWIGLGCHIGKVGEIWEPKYMIYRNNF